MRDEKKKHSIEELKNQSDSILFQLECHQAFQKAHTVMLYASLPDEVQTLDFLETWRWKKKIILPVVHNDDIIPTEFGEGIVLKNGSFNIPEPQNNPYFGGFDLMVIPGMAFDKMGHRLGRGRGYYDRFLANFPDVYKIGICFDFQLVNNIPNESHDQMVDEVISFQ